MKSLFTAVLLLLLDLVHGQYSQQRFNLNYTVPLLRNEVCNTGIRTRVNYNGNPAAFYLVGMGTSYKNAILPSPDNAADRMRFTLSGNSGSPVIKTGYEFHNGDDKVFHSYGNGIAEVNDGMGTGGFVAVGAVANNDSTGAGTVGGNSDALFVQLSTAGTVLSTRGIDVNNGADRSWCIRRSAVPDPQGLPTWIMCGQSQHPTYTDCFVARVHADGSPVWLNRYNFDPTPQGGGNPSAHCIAKQLCEDAAGNIYAVGTLQDNQGGGFIKALAFKLNAGGAVQWANNYDAGPDNEFQAVRLTADNNLIVGGFTSFGAMAPVTHNMLIVKLNSVNGGILFQRILQALASNGVTKYTSKCYDIVETAGPQYFLAGSLIRNGGKEQMMYRAGAGGMGIEWYAYNPLLIDAGFGLDNINTGNFPGIAYFSSIKNPDSPSVSDSHIMTTDYTGRTCLFCTTRPPRNIPINQEVHNQNQWLKSPAGEFYKLFSKTYDYDHIVICHENEIQCGVMDIAQSAAKSTSPAEPKARLNASPNPVSGILNIRFYSMPAGEYQIAVLSMKGEVVLQKGNVFNSGSLSIKLDMSAVASGVYLVEARKGNLVWRQKVVKQ